MGIVLKVSRKARMEEAVKLGQLLLSDSLREATLSEKREMKTVGKMVMEKKGIAFVTALIDQCFRRQSDARVANQLEFLIRQFTLPAFLSMKERAGFLLFHYFGDQFPSYFVPRLKKKIFQEMSAFFRKKREKGSLINLNHLGEA